MSGQDLSFAMLGPLEVRLDGVPVRLGGPKERLVLAVLLAQTGRVVSTEALVDALWEEDPPTRAAATLQVHVSKLRQRLGSGRPTIITQAPGYVLPTSATDLDALRFEELVALARESSAHGDPQAALANLDLAVALWRGRPLEDLESVRFVEDVRAHWEERLATTEETRLGLLLALRRPEEAALLADAAVRRYPLRESLHAQLMLALYRSGRQAEALAAYRSCRELLLDELGIDPSPRLRDMERAILAHDPVLDAPVRDEARPDAPTPAASGDSVEPAVTYVAARREGALLLADGTRVALDGVVTLGRHPDSVVVLPDPSVSRHHAEIRPALGGHLLVDLASSNGTVVSGEQVMQHLLSDGDEILIGGHKLRYVAE